MLRPRMFAPLKRAFGNAPTRIAGGVCPQPEVFAPLHVAPSIRETVKSSRLPTNTVLVAVTIPTDRGPLPTGTVATATQPLVFVPLQTLPLITETVLSPVFVTYSVRLTGLKPSPCGELPTTATGQPPTGLQPLVSALLQ